MSERLNRFRHNVGLILILGVASVSFLEGTMAQLVPGLHSSQGQESADPTRTPIQRPPAAEIALKYFSSTADLERVNIKMATLDADNTPFLATQVIGRNVLIIEHNASSSFLSQTPGKVSGRTFRVIADEVSGQVLKGACLIRS